MGVVVVTTVLGVVTGVVTGVTVLVKVTLSTLVFVYGTTWVSVVVVVAEVVLLYFV
jgi:hypothetical protein